MGFSISQQTYAVRDASEIAFGILILGIVLMPLAAGVTLIGLAFIGALVPEPFASAIAGSTVVLFWLGLMALIVRRYQRIAASWGEERRGKGMFHLLEWLTLGANLLMSLAENAHDTFLPFRIFLTGLMLLMLISHALTYALLRYQPYRREIIVWSALVAVLLFELFR